MRKLLIATLGALLLSGCVTSGTKIDPTVVSTFKPGVTTVGEAEASLGQPNEVTETSDGGKVLVYAFTKAQASGSSYIPIVGAFVGHSDADTQYTQLTFDKNGKFVKSSVTTGHTSAKFL